MTGFRHNVFAQMRCLCESDVAAECNLSPEKYGLLQCPAVLVVRILPAAKRPTDPASSGALRSAKRR